MNFTSEFQEEKFKSNYLHWSSYLLLSQEVSTYSAYVITLIYIFVAQRRKTTDIEIPGAIFSCLSKTVHPVDSALSP